MKLISPDYYESFRCIAGACRHSCCKGWEIDVDEDTLSFYQQLPGSIGDRLRSQIDMENGCFRLGEDERCPFLNDEGLCDIIIQLGEGALCQICDDHPRFRNFLSGRTEIGLGLCCEAAGALILSQKEPVRLIELEDDSEQDEDDEAFLRWRDQLISIAQDRRLPVARRVDKLLAACGTCMQFEAAHWADVLLGLERLEDSWTHRLNALKNVRERELSSQWEIPFEQLLVYLLYRHLAGAVEDGDAQGRVTFAALMWTLLRRMFTENSTMEDLIELARVYSAEIEYSDENIGAILNQIHQITD